MKTFFVARFQINKESDSKENDSVNSEEIFHSKNFDC